MKNGESMKNIDVICFGGNDWWYHNRNHFDTRMMEQFAKFENVLYVNSVVMQKPKLSQGRKFVTKVVRKTKSILKGLQKNDAGFWIYSPFSLPVHHIGGLRMLNGLILRLQLRFMIWKLGIRMPIVWVACPAACDAAARIKKVKLVYQRTDRFEEYPNVDVKTISQYDRRLKTDADLTVFVSKTLYEQEYHQCKKAILLDHGVDYEIFATAENTKEAPLDIRDIEGPIVGFFGGIDDHTSDIGLVKKVVELLPEMSFVFIGKVSVDCQDLLCRKNVRMLGQKPYEQIPHYGKCFDVAIMPWRQNRWIQACNPIKLKEYLALGKPVVSTPFAELQKYRDVVYEAKTPREFANSIKGAIRHNDPKLVMERREKVKNSSWDSKAELVLKELLGKDFNCQVRN